MGVRCKGGVCVVGGGRGWFDLLFMIHYLGFGIGRHDPQVAGTGLNIRPLRQALKGFQIATSAGWRPPRNDGFLDSRFRGNNKGCGGGGPREIGRCHLTG